MTRSRPIAADPGASGTVSRRITWAETTPFPDNPIYPRRLEEMAKRGGGYNPKLLQAPVLVDNGGDAFPELPPDALIVLNGNHRRELARLHDHMDDEFIAILHRGLKRREVFLIRDGVNVQRTVKPAERFLNLASQGDPECLNIIAAVEGLGWRVTHERAPGGLSCTNELQWIWRQNQAAMIGAIRSYHDIWGRRDASAQARVIKGLGAFWIRYPDANLERLAVAMKRTSFTVNQLYEAGKVQDANLPALRGIWDGIRFVLATTYNRGHRSGHLPVP